MDNGEQPRPALALSPGTYLAGVLEQLDVSPSELARRSGCPADVVDGVLNGTTVVTPEIAVQIEKAVGVPAQVWVELESDYRRASGSAQ